MVYWFLTAMRKALVFSVLIGFNCLIGDKGYSETVCSRDYLGRTVCRTSGGNTITGTRDYLGRDVWRGSDGYQQVCKTDYLGRYVCR